MVVVACRRPFKHSHTFVHTALAAQSRRRASQEDFLFGSPKARAARFSIYLRYFCILCKFSHFQSIFLNEAHAIESTQKNKIQCRFINN